MGPMVQSSEATEPKFKNQVCRAASLILFLNTKRKERNGGERGGGAGAQQVRMGMRDSKEGDEVKLTNLILYPLGVTGTELRQMSYQLFTRLR